jgi:hypothetical protein
MRSQQRYRKHIHGKDLRPAYINSFNLMLSMRNIFFIKEKLSVRIAYYHIMVFGMVLPFDRFFSELVLVSLLIHTLIHLKKTDVSGIFNKRVILLQSLFFVALICSFYSADKPQAMAELEKQLAILLFPFLLYIHRDVIHRYKNRLLFMLAVTATMVISYLYIDALRIIVFAHLPLQTLFSAKFLNMNFTEAIDMHPTFLVFICSSGACIFFENIFQIRRKETMGIFFNKYDDIICRHHPNEFPFCDYWLADHFKFHRSFSDQ